ncbi:peptide chain release factor N(5)-glutamine methyltransferase [Botrimarina hoheduenensis]|uniref:Release factor glutamine methyltransferase n=1 Tax=Botrimarina hoheduenensis TaxID=2528000 RepID=A0A5C5VYU5_9BACT|nr:peptide chain release factor N(5)-glutamine methyltransferase [Botrimarina hoheduenensis]TWT43215.1 Release factor glutamine methyltransferase [Botrimarina hoheduenensis]
MPDTTPWSVLRLLNWTTDFFKQHGNESPRLDAEVLLAQSLACKRIELYTRFDEVPAEPVRTAFKALVKQRADGAPVAYLVGRREFYSIELAVEAGVLIPRPETELLVVTALDRLKQRADEAPLLVDVGTGTGAIAIAIAKHAPAARIVALDMNPQAVALAKRNAETHGVAERVAPIESDLFSRVKASRRFDLILSNPPYVTTNELMNLDETVRDHEPHLALDGGPEGTTVIERLLAEAPQRLADGGELLFEIGPSIAQRVETLVGQAPGLSLREVYKDLAGLPRVVHAVNG